MLAAGLSPLLPKAFADDSAWKPILADRAWDYQTHNVQRLTVDAGANSPTKIAGVTFLTNPSSDCTNSVNCDHVDLTILAGGKQEVVPNVDAKFLNSTFEVGQNGKFVYFTKSADLSKWFTAFAYDPKSKETQTLTTLDRKANELNLVTFVTRPDRLYASIMQSDPKTKKVETSLVGKNIGGEKYEERNISFNLSAPWQEITDAQNDILLTKFTFSGGNKQLWLINARTQQMSAIPNTWTDPQGDILYAHFLSDGTVVFFQNYRLYTFNPSLDKIPQSYDSAILSWNGDMTQNVQIVGDEMSFSDANHVLYFVDTNGVTFLPTVKDGSVHLASDALYFADAKGSWKYDIRSKTTTETFFLVTDTLDTLRVGLDTKGTVWLQNTANNTLINLGSGSRPLLSDANHVIWKGTDGSIYQATLSSLLSMQRMQVAAFRTSDSNTVYLATNNSLWTVPNEKTYLTWFSSWNRVTTLSPKMMASMKATHTLMGDAGFAPGTRVKAIGDSRVYMVGNDGQMHWIISETVASTIYGSSWNKGIVEVNSTDLWRFANGKNIESDQSVKTL